MKNKLFIVLLRRPTNKPDEMRSDPFWEFGSFGLTGCHSKNLLNTKKVEELNNCRLAFVQGGKDGFKLLLITPKVSSKIIKGNVEVKWKPIKPFKYKTAPIVINNELATNFSYLQKYFLNLNRTTLEGKFASAFRARTTPLDDDIADKLIKDFQVYFRKSKTSDRISDYTEALPSPPPLIDKNRAKTYTKLNGLAKRKC